jgi:hypothetical protein
VPYKYDDLTGKTFGKLTALEVVGRAKNRTILWRCRCSCGAETIVRANHLKHRHTTSCGCFHKEKLTDLYVKDLTGQRFERLVVQSRSNKKVGRAATWHCLCDCGNVIETTTSSLTTGHTKSCGCLHFDTIWKGGISCGPYCQNWTNEFKNYIKERDGNKCLNPYCYGGDGVLAVHHIDYNKKNCHPSNLITVCRSCNSRANKDRRWHKAWYQTIIKRRYNYEN